jgi:Leucine-rich repeat (LRR) protein
MNKLLLSIGIAFCTMSAQAQVDIPDPLFKEALIAKGVDENNDGQIQIAEAVLVTKIDIGSYYIIKNLEGIQAFSNLTYLNCSDIQTTKLDVSKNLELTYLDCSRTRIGLLDVGKNTALTLLNCSYNL